MQLRFLKGNWKFGKFKLQQSMIAPHLTNGCCGDNDSLCPRTWVDVPIEEEVKESKCTSGNSSNFGPVTPTPSYEYTTFSTNPKSQKKPEGECQNCFNKKPGEGIAVVFERDNYADSKHLIVVKCAICFTKFPRRVAKTLEEKILDCYLNRSSAGGIDKFIDALVQICEQHFKHREP